MLNLSRPIGHCRRRLSSDIDTSNLVAPQRKRDIGTLFNILYNSVQENGDVKRVGRALCAPGRAMTRDGAGRRELRAVSCAADR